MILRLLHILLECSRPFGAYRRQGLSLCLRGVNPPSLGKEPEPGAV